MPIDAKVAAKTIESAVTGVPAAAAAATAAAIAPGDFCNLWKQAKPILEVVSGVVILIPGLGAIAGGVLKGLIKIGDQIAAEVCG